jgi:hypothetical protein
MDYPTYIMVNGKRYDINTDFRVAIECNVICLDKNISDYERALALIYKLYGEEGINNPADYEKLLEGAKKYLSCGKEEEKKSDEEPDMDYIQDYDYIEASFMSDYHIDLSETKMHWWKFFKLINGLSNSEMGNCCILNRIRNIRTMDTSDIKDRKLLQTIMEQKKKFALNKKEPSEAQKNSARAFYEMLKRGDYDGTDR